MDVEEAASKAAYLVRVLASDEWTLIFLRSKRQLGVCRHSRKQIGLSREFVRLNEWNVVEQAVLHEIAHAMVGPGHGHDGWWKTVAISLGVKDPRASQTIPVPPSARYQATCTRCGQEHGRHRRPRSRADGMIPQLACGPCCKKHAGGRFDDRFLLTYIDTLTSEPMRPTFQSKPRRREPIMSDELTAPQLAQQIGTDPKTLRRFLRENDSYRNPGSGKRYSFTKSEAASVERAFKNWISSRRPRSSKTTGETSPKQTRTTNAKRRVDALEESLKRSGKHLSQHSS